MVICFLIVNGKSLANAEVTSIADCQSSVADREHVQELNVYYFRLALCEAEFINNEKEFYTVIDLFKKATVNTTISFEPQAYFALGFLLENKYKNGQTLYGVAGKPSDLIEAVDYYEKAASLGCSIAKYKLGMIYFSKQKQNTLLTSSQLPSLPKSILWLTQAAKEGYAEAQFKLSTLYQQGIGLPKDIIQAYLWQSVAIASQKRYNKALMSSPFAAQYLSSQKKVQINLYNQLTAAQKNEVSQLLPRYYQNFLKPPGGNEENCEQMQSLLAGNALRKVLNTLQVPQ